MNLVPSFFLFSVLAVAPVMLRAAADGPVPAAAASAGQLLEAARRPFLEPEWCRFRGEIQWRGARGRFQGPLALAMRLAPDRLEAELVLGDGDGQLSRVVQEYRPAPELPMVALTLPEVAPGAVTLRTMGVEPDDLTFSFLYWKLAQELPGESIRGQPCRVLELVHPQRLEKVRAWLHGEYAFPLRVQWFLPGESLYNRQLEFTDFKRDGAFWYPTGIRLAGPEWRTRIQFQAAAIASPAVTPEPPDLFRKP